jgi:hypothetical protein
MSAIHTITGFLVDRLLAPFSRPWPALAAAALATAILMLLIVRWTARANATRRAKDRLTARVLELVLFRHDAVVSFTAAGRILGANARYLGTLLVPLGLGMGPCLLILAQLSCWFAWRPLAIGETAAVEVHMRGRFPVDERLVALADSGNAWVETLGVRVQTPAEVAWRVRARQEGVDWLSIQVAGESEVRKQLVVGEAWQKTVPRRTGGGFWQSLWYPGEPLLDAASSIEEVVVHYPPRQLYLGTMEVDWILAFVVLAVGFGLILKRPLGVQL